jgi:hypothetical protein
MWQFPQALSGQPSNRDNAASSVAATIGSSHEVDHPDVVAVSGTDKKSSVELIDRTAYVLPVTNQMDKKPSQKNTHQASENDQSAIA